MSFQHLTMQLGNFYGNRPKYGLPVSRTSWPKQHELCFRSRQGAGWLVDWLGGTVPGLLIQTYGGSHGSFPSRLLFSNRNINKCSRTESSRSHWNHAGHTPAGLCGLLHRCSCCAGYRQEVQRHSEKQAVHSWYGEVAAKKKITFRTCRVFLGTACHTLFVDCCTISPGYLIVSRMAKLWAPLWDRPGWSHPG